MFYAEKKDGICKRPIARIGRAPAGVAKQWSGEGTRGTLESRI